MVRGARFLRVVGVWRGIRADAIDASIVLAAVKDAARR
jgi:hypothetical protein